jgi:hypothetical protein
MGSQAAGIGADFWRELSTAIGRGRRAHAAVAAVPGHQRHDKRSPPQGAIANDPFVEQMVKEYSDEKKAGDQARKTSR